MYQVLQIPDHYGSGKEDHIVRDFYIPVLAETLIYKRIVGAFTIESLILAAKGITELVANGGHFQLILSANIDEEYEIKTINNVKAKEKLIENKLLEIFDVPKDDFIKARLNTIAFLMANKQLEIKIIYPRDNSFKGIHYERMGICEDSSGKIIGFSNQINEASGEYQSNYETMDIFCSWNPYDQRRVKRRLEVFNQLWQRGDSLYRVMELPQTVHDCLLHYKDETKELIEPEIQSQANKSKGAEGFYPVIPSFIKLREYQQEAIRNWFRNNCQGLLEMATGTGKTITALTASVKLWEVTNRLGVIIVCPYVHLVDQWVKDIKAFNMSPIIAYQSKALWEEPLYNEVSAFNTGIIKHFCVITTASTFSTPTMQGILKKLTGDTLFIADEAHHLGAQKNKENLIDSIPYRLALTATPNRWHDEEGTDDLIRYFGNSIVFQYGLEQAIGEFLTEYYYYPHIVYLDEDEYEHYLEVTKKIARMSSINSDSKKMTESVQGLLIERARILGRARNKLIALKDLMKERTDSKYNIVYCGDSTIDGEKQIDSVVNILGNELQMNVHTFTSREDKEQRKKLLKRFESGSIQTLVAIKCLDEGVDVPATQTAYILASSTNPREFIQRRGRVLRKHKNKEYSYIHDFIVLPRKLEEMEFIETNVFNIERKMIRRELLRFSEFADLAINGPIAHEKIDAIKKSYNLLDI